MDDNDSPLRQKMAVTAQIQRDTPALVEQTLASHGGWDAVAYLLTNHYLPSEEYEAWRMGEVAFLEETQINGQPQLLERLDAALAYAQAMGLEIKPKTWHGWGNIAGQPLRLFRDEKTNRRFQLRLVPKAARMQLDLFMDAPQTMMLDRLRQMVLQRNHAVATLFAQARDQLGNHASLTKLEAIHTAMEGLEITQPVAWFDYLDRVIAPAAAEEFPRRANDIMLPLWRAVAQAMASLPLDPHHASEAWLRAQSWQQCLASIAHTPDWHTHARLHRCRIAALTAMGEQTAAQQAWMLFCWLQPNDAASALEQSDLHACALQRYWQQFTQFDPALGTEDFPALMALYGKLETVSPAEFALAAPTPGWHHYQRIQDLLRHESPSAPDPNRRRALKASSPELFQAFMATRRRQHG
ncbi:MAG: hypothetical protein Q9M26_05135 [Mariprofundales bacterium]|nr:hypothetical protein [Mariprofundales bacterium]